MTYKHTYLAQKLNFVMGKVVLASAAGQEKAISIPHMKKSWPLSFLAYTYCTIIIYNSLDHIIIISVSVLNLLLKITEFDGWRSK